MVARPVVDGWRRVLASGSVPPLKHGYEAKMGVYYMTGKAKKVKKVSVDAGNSVVNAYDGKKLIHFPSVRAIGTDRTLGISQFELQYTRYTWLDHVYVAGDDVTTVSRRAMERHMGANRYGGEAHRFFTAVALTRLGIKPGPLQLCLFMPPGIFAKNYPEKPKMVKDNFLGNLEIVVSGEKKPFVYEVTDATILPEGLAAAFALAFDDNGNAVDTEALDGRVAVIDVGGYTTDALQLLDGSFNPELLAAATSEDDGVNLHVLQPVLNAVKPMADDFDLLTVDDIDVVIRKGTSTGDYTLTAGAKSVDIKPLVDKARLRLAEVLADNVAAGVFQDFRGYARVILVGGGSALIADYFKAWFGNKVIDYTDQANTSNLHPGDLNAVGGYRFMMMIDKQSED